MMIYRPLLLCLMLTACGSGSDDDAPPEPTPVPGATMSVTSPSLRTVAGGTALPLAATLSSGGAIRWQLQAGAPGSLSATTGGAVRYQPPASGLGAASVIDVTASGDGASATLKLAVTPDPGAPGLTLLAGDGQLLTRDGTGAAASFANPVKLATDITGNVYVMEYEYSPVGTYPPVRLRKIAPNGVVTTLAGKVDGVDYWFGQPDSGGNARRLDVARGFSADAAGNLYVSMGLGYGHTGEVPGLKAGVFKITPSGALTLLAGSEEIASPATTAMVDGQGGAARFLFPRLVGSDFSGNLFLLDTDPRPASATLLTPRKVTPTGLVTTLPALPANLDSDMNGNTYRYDRTTRSILRTTPDGVISKEADAPFCGDFPENLGQEYASNNCVRDIIPQGGASYLLISGYRIVRMVVRR